MSFRTFMIVTTLVSGAFGVSFLLFPEPTSGIYGTPFSPSVAMLDRFFGSALVGLALFAWAFNEVRDTALIGRLLIAHAAHDAIGCAVAVNASYTHVLNAMGWSSALVYALLAAGCAVVYRSLPTAQFHVA